MEADAVVSKESIESVSNFDAAKDLQKLGYAQELTRVRCKKKAQAHMILRVTDKGIGTYTI
jgi:hypothetical protein